MLLIVRIISILLIGTVGAGSVLYLAKDTDFVKENIPIVNEIFNKNRLSTSSSEEETAIKLKNNITDSLNSEKKITKEQLDELYEQVERAKEKLIKEYVKYIKLQNEVYKKTGNYFECIVKNNIKLSIKDLETIKKVFPKKDDLQKKIKIPKKHIEEKKEELKNNPIQKKEDKKEEKKEKENLIKKTEELKKGDFGF